MNLWYNFYIIYIIFFKINDQSFLKIDNCLVTRYGGSTMSNLSFSLSACHMVWADNVPNLVRGPCIVAWVCIN
jgi:hypothetical protein